MSAIKENLHDEITAAQQASEQSIKTPIRTFSPKKFFEDHSQEMKPGEVPLEFNVHYSPEYINAYLLEERNKNKFIELRDIQSGLKYLAHNLFDTSHYRGVSFLCESPGQLVGATCSRMEVIAIHTL